MAHRSFLTILTLSLLAGTAQAQTNEEPTQPAKVDYVLPPNKLTGEIMYLTLAGDLSLHRGRPDVAYDTYMRLAAKTRDPRYAELAYKISVALQNTQATLESASLLKELAPNAVAGQDAIRNAKLGQAYALADKQEYRPAYLAAKEILAKEPKNVEALSLLSEMADYLGYDEESLSAAERWVQLTPDSAEALNTLGYFLADRNIRLNEAATLITKANQMAPFTPHIMDSIGWLAYRQGDLDSALSVLKQTAAFEPDDVILSHLAEVMWQKGQSDEAIRTFKIAYRTNAFSNVLRDTLERLDIPLDLIRYTAPKKGLK